MLARQMLRPLSISDRVIRSSEVLVKSKLSMADWDEDQKRRHCNGLIIPTTQLVSNKSRAVVLRMVVQTKQLHHVKRQETPRHHAKSFPTLVQCAGTSHWYVSTLGICYFTCLADCMAMRGHTHTGLADTCLLSRYGQPRTRESLSFPHTPTGSFNDSQRRVIERLASPRRPLTGEGGSNVSAHL